MKDFILGILFFILGFRILRDGKIYSNFYEYDFSSMHVDTILGILIIMVSIGFFYLAFRPKSKKPPEFTKCPKCKESYYYTKTNNGKCPKCNIDTIEISKFYAKNF